jgi:DNA-binding HxlR family transcriptional regulator
MTTSLGTDIQCSIARSLEVLGEKWTLLIVRDAFAGVTRFTEFQRSLGIAKNLLADRLETLVEFGVLDRRAYREDGSRERSEYVLSDSGRELIYVIAALIGWGDVHRPTKLGPTRIIRDSETEEILHLAFVNKAGIEVPQSRAAAEIVR